MDTRISSATGMANKHEELGIREFVGQHPKLTAIFKERYSDFHVHEIDSNGQRVQLTDMNAPKEQKITVSSTDPDLIPILSEEIQNKVNVLHDLTLQKKRLETVPVEIDVTKLDKQQRTKIHRWVGSFEGLGSSTVDKGEQKFIVVEYATHKSRRRPETRGKFTNCVLYKEGIETSDAILSIAKKLRIHHNLITYAGTKDKQAKTSQRITVTNIEARRLIDVCKHMNHVKLGNFEYTSKALQLGDLKGNHFKILLKNVKLTEDDEMLRPDKDDRICSVVDVVITSMRNVGFINYYGLQRFGSYVTSTHAIGKAVLQMKWDRVFDLILQEKPRDTDFMIEIKKKWLATRDAQACIKLLPSWHRSIETNLLQGLARHYELGDFLGAFQRIPRNVRQLYLHSFQSYLWNHMATFRVQKFGLKPVVGDFVYNSRDVTPETVHQLEDITLNIDDSGVIDGATEIPAEIVTRKLDVTVLKEEDLEKYSIYDVLLPLFGTELLKHPNKVMQDYYDKLLLDQGLDTDCFLKFKPRYEAPKGSYRHLIVLPKNVDYKLIPYNNSDNLDKFIQSDLDLLKHSKSQESKEAPEESGNGEGVAVKDKTCAIVEFSLPPASYATMALRELLEYSALTQPPRGPDVDSSKRTKEEEESENPAKKPRVVDPDTN